MKASKLLAILTERTNNLLPSNSLLNSCVSLIVRDWRVGIVKPEISAVLLRDFPQVFIPGSGGCLRLRSELAGFDAISSQLASVFTELRRRNAFVSLHGWRNEEYAVRCRATGESLFKLERTAASLLGVLQWGCHVNGYTVGDDGEGLAMWVARRSLSKPTWPGCYDNLVGGGLPHGASPLANARKESAEEAGIGGRLLDGLRPVGTVSYFFADERGVFPDVEFCYDLRLPADFRPANADGEVCEFRLVPVAELVDWLGRDDFKPNSALVCLDFLIRHGAVSADSEPLYELLVELCHVRLPLD